MAGAERELPHLARHLDRERAHAVPRLLGEVEAPRVIVSEVVRVLDQLRTPRRRTSERCGADRVRRRPCAAHVRRRAAWWACLLPRGWSRPWHTARSLPNSPDSAATLSTPIATKPAEHGELHGERGHSVASLAAQAWPARATKPACGVPREAAMIEQTACVRRHLAHLVLSVISAQRYVSCSH